VAGLVGAGKYQQILITDLVYSFVEYPFEVGSREESGFARVLKLSHEAFVLSAKN